MKKIVFALVLLISFHMMGQIAIGKTDITNTSVSLEFGAENRGLLLPWVTAATDVAGAVNGTMIYDLSDHKIKVKYASGWNDLSIDMTGTTLDPLTSVDGVLIQNSANEDPSAKVSIGVLSNVPGILVLEDTDKAMILPKVESPHLNIINPAPGMIVYDTVAKQLAVFNGNMWSFWTSQ